MPQGSNNKLIASSPAAPRSISLNADGTISITAQAGGAPVGSHVQVELQNPANNAAVWTVPSGKTFSGSAYILNTTGGSLSLSAATGGVFAAITGVGYDLVDGIVIAGGAGNAITALVSGGALGTVLLSGYYK